MEKKVKKKNIKIDRKRNKSNLSSVSLFLLISLAIVGTGIQSFHTIIPCPWACIRQSNWKWVSEYFSHVTDWEIFCHWILFFSRSPVNLNLLLKMNNSTVKAFEILPNSRQVLKIYFGNTLDHSLGLKFQVILLGTSTQSRYYPHLWLRSSQCFWNKCQHFKMMEFNP